MMQGNAFFIMVKLFLYAFFILTMPQNKNVMDNSLIWIQLNEITWKKDNNWAGEGYTFCETTDGTKRCVTQVYGSGVYVVSPLTYYKVDIINDTIQLLLNKASTQAAHDYQVMEILVLSNGVLKTADGKASFVIFSQTPVIYDIKYPSSGKKISVEELKKHLE